VPHILWFEVDINKSALGSDTSRSIRQNIYTETDLATKARALATLARKDKAPATGGWSQKPEVMAFLRAS
jgi:hypothetical protein